VKTRKLKKLFEKYQGRKDELSGLQVCPPAMCCALFHQPVNDSMLQQPSTQHRATRVTQARLSSADVTMLHGMQHASTQYAQFVWMFGHTGGPLAAHCSSSREGTSRAAPVTRAARGGSPGAVPAGAGGDAGGLPHADAADQAEEPGDSVLHPARVPGPHHAALPLAGLRPDVGHRVPAVRR
jgi:hypothetical protein